MRTIANCPIPKLFSAKSLRPKTHSNINKCRGEQEEKKIAKEAAK